MNGKDRRVDYHIHSLFSVDGHATISQICERALAMGLDEIGITDHLDLEPSDEGYGFFNYEAYTATIACARETFGDRLTIRKGVEVDYQTVYEAEIRRLLRKMHFDYKVGSVHYLGHQRISTDLIARKGLKWIYKTYLPEVINSAKSGLFQVIGHYDMIQRYINGSGATKFMKERKAALDEIISNKLFLEINTRNLMEAYGDTMPRLSLVEAYLKKDGRLFSIGSDAHLPRLVGSGVDEVRDFLAKLGNREIKIIFE